MAHQGRVAVRSRDKASGRGLRHSKPPRSYHVPSTDEDDDYDDTPLAEARSSRELRSSKRRHSPSPSPDPIAAPVPAPATALARRTPTKRAKTTKSSRPSTKSIPPKSKPAKTASHQVGAPRRARQKTSPKDAEVIFLRSGVVPPWATLPYQVLLSIFHYASHPLYDERTFHPTSSVDWLLKMSRLCRAFAEPALTALYRSPPTVPMDKAHLLKEHLERDHGTMLYNYRSKIERIQMEISLTAAYTLTGHGVLDLSSFVWNCPRLLDLELYHLKDMSPYRSLDENLKWTYPEGLFGALNDNVAGAVTALRSWRWSSRLAGKRFPLERLHTIHQHPCFAQLRKIAFVNYQKPAKRKDEDQPSTENEKALAKSLTVLPLEHLVFESCTLLNKHLFPLLPTNLVHLEIINCWEVVSEVLAPFLRTHGSQLRSLTLNHNSSLNLSFLEELAPSCPKLEHLKVNMTFYSVHPTYRDSDCWFDSLLEADEIPTWPSSLQSIELTQLRKWDVDTAKMFFQSLLNSAETLPDLRRLVIRATIDTNWRERSTFRDEWLGAFNRVFKRPFKPPNRLWSRVRKRPAAAPAVLSGDMTPLPSSRFANDSFLQKLVKSFAGDAVSPQHNSRGSPTKGDHKHTPPANTRPPTRLSTRQSSGSSKEVLHNIALAGTLDDDSDASSNVSERELKRKASMRTELRRLRTTVNFVSSTHPSNHSSNHPSYHEGSDTSVDSDEPLAVAAAKKKATAKAGFAAKAGSAAKADAAAKAANGATTTSVTQEKKEQFIQGMCDIVSITIDNLRPTENQFVEADFLDSEPEGDEDWSADRDGEEDEEGDGGYAW